MYTCGRRSRQEGFFAAYAVQDCAARSSAAMPGFFICIMVRIALPDQDAEHHPPNCRRWWSRCLYINADHSSGVSLPKKQCGCVVQPADPAAANRSINPHSRPCSTVKSRSFATTSSFAVGEFGRIGSSSRKTAGFMAMPMIRPISSLDGRICPMAISIDAEQCASACAGFIVPHSRWLSGRNCRNRSFTSSTLAASNRFFTRKCSPCAESRVLVCTGPAHKGSRLTHLSLRRAFDRGDVELFHLHDRLHRPGVLQQV